MSVFVGSLIFMLPLASAQVTRVDFQAVVTGKSLGGKPFGMNPAIGDLVFATFVYDPLATAVPTSQGFEYPQVATHYVITIDGNIVTPATLDWQIIIGSTPLFDAVHFEHHSNGPGFIAVNGIVRRTGIFQFTLFDDETPPLGSAALPTFLPDLTEWEKTTAFIRDEYTGAQIDMTLVRMEQVLVPGRVVGIPLGSGPAVPTHPVLPPPSQDEAPAFGILKPEDLDLVGVDPA